MEEIRKWFWVDCNGKMHSDMYHEDRCAVDKHYAFMSFIEETARQVRKWPAWKRGLLGKISPTNNMDD